MKVTLKSKITLHPVFEMDVASVEEAQQILKEDLERSPWETISDDYVVMWWKPNSIDAAVPIESVTTERSDIHKPIPIKENTYIRIKHCAIETWEDDYNEGQIGNGTNYQEIDDLYDMRFDTVEQALHKTCDILGLSYPEDGFDIDNDQFYRPGEGSVFRWDWMVDEDNNEVTESELEEWKQGNKKLWCLQLALTLSNCVETPLICKS